MTDIPALVAELRAARIVTYDFDPLATLPRRAADALEAQAKELAVERENWDAALESGKLWRERAEKAEQDERIEAWMTIADHPAFRPAYDHDGTLIEGFMERLDALTRAEQERDAAHAKLEKVRLMCENEGDKFRPIAARIESILSAAPGDVLREHDERVWDRGFHAAIRSDIQPVNPYR